LKALKAQKNKLLTGRILSIDPSSGSISRATGERSQAGWAVFDKASLESSGIITITGYDKTQRLQDLANTLSTEFDEKFDLLIMENIWGYIAHQTLVQACGAIIANTQTDMCIEINMKRWQGVANRLGGWTKSDENDAIYLGAAAMCLAEGYNHTALKTDKKRQAALDDLALRYDCWNIETIKEALHERSIGDNQEQT